MILAAACHSDLCITEENLQQAEQLVTSLEVSLPNVFNQIVDNRDAQNTALIIRIIQSNPGGVKRRALWRKVIMRMSQDEFRNAVMGAINADFIKEHTIGDEPTYYPLELPQEKAPAASDKAL